MQDTDTNILFLGDPNSPVLAWLEDNDESVIQTTGKISPQYIRDNKIHFLISYGYRHIIKKEILDLFPNRAINLHISYLPWNRGSDPNLWSFINNTPKGVTIHYLDEGIDTGDIIVQQEIEFILENETLATSYQKLQTAVQELFKKNWMSIKNETCPRKQQVGQGSLQKSNQKVLVVQSLTNGWATLVSELEKYGAVPETK